MVYISLYSISLSFCWPIGSNFIIILSWKEHHFMSSEFWSFSSPLDVVAIIFATNVDNINWSLTCGIDFRLIIRVCVWMSACMSVCEWVCACVCGSEWVGRDWHKSLLVILDLKRSSSKFFDQWAFLSLLSLCYMAFIARASWSTTVRVAILGDDLSRNGGCYLICMKLLR